MGYFCALRPKTNSNKYLENGHQSLFVFKNVQTLSIFEVSAIKLKFQIFLRRENLVGT